MKYLGWSLLVLVLGGWARADGGGVEFKGGCFLMGAEEGGYCEERPAHPVCIDSFVIDATEVTNEQYGACVRAGV
ncbi:MAG: formylglycine-generating enzyme family protein, partial [Myxococcota bacterium]|nr:formylglycine-generating enzyme family protein [Myxococcota bacterium]